MDNIIIIVLVVLIAIYINKSMKLFNNDNDKLK